MHAKSAKLLLTGRKDRETSKAFNDAEKPTIYASN